jgi:hypothetical protein
MVVKHSNPKTATANAMADVQRTLESAASTLLPQEKTDIAIDVPAERPGTALQFLNIRISETEKAVFKSFFYKYGFTLSSGCLLAMRYMQQLVDEGKIEITKTGIRER